MATGLAGLTAAGLIPCAGVGHDGRACAVGLRVWGRKAGYYGTRY